MKKSKKLRKEQKCIVNLLNITDSHILPGNLLERIEEIANELFVLKGGKAEKGDCNGKFLPEDIEEFNGSQRKIVADREELKRGIVEAIRVQNYEEAARLRDILEGLN